MKKEDFDQYLKQDLREHYVLGKDQLRQYAVLVSLVEVDGDYHFLFEKRAPGIRQGSEISFPGGGFEADKDTCFEDTAIRETCEELGICPDQVRVITQLDTFVSHVYIENYLAILEVDDLEDLAINTDEVAYVFTLPVQYFLDNPPEIYGIKVKSFSSEEDQEGNLVEYFPVKDLDLPERYHRSWNERTREVYVYRTPHGTLWGITALIVYDTLFNFFNMDPKS